MDPMALLAIALLIGLVAGGLGGLLGVGGGVVMVPAFLRLLGMSAREAVGTSMGVILFTALVASGRHYQLGHVNTRVVLVVAGAAMVGGWLGASLTARVPDRTLRVLFALFLIAVAVQMLLRAWRESPAA